MCSLAIERVLLTVNDGNNHEQEEGLPTYLENLPKMDRLLTDVGFERSSTQKMTLGDGNCGPRGNYYHSD